MSGNHLYPSCCNSLPTSEPFSSFVSVASGRAYTAIIRCYLCIILKLLFLIGVDIEPSSQWAFFKQNLICEHHLMPGKKCSKSLNGGLRGSLNFGIKVIMVQILFEFWSLIWYQIIPDTVSAERYMLVFVLAVASFQLSWGVIPCKIGIAGLSRLLLLARMGSEDEIVCIW